MTTGEYESGVTRTMAKQQDILDRLHNSPRYGSRAMQLLNGLTGLTNELGELADLIKGHVEYGRELDLTEMKGEVGDCLWRLVQLSSACGFTLEQAMIGNRDKLAVRYGTSFSETKANDRDLKTERSALVGATTV